MAKNKNKKNGRDTGAIANEVARFYNSEPLAPRITKLLTEYEDRRTWHPMGPKRPARSFNRSSHRLVAPQPITRRRSQRGAKTTYSRSPIYRVGFENPEKVLVCVRRKTRREVLFAKKFSGRGRLRRPKYGYYSRISCRR